MSNVNYKNHLQEYFQKQCISQLPKYKTIKVGGAAHTPVWRSEVTLFGGGIYTGDASISKSAAEISAAGKALEKLNIIGSFSAAEISTTEKITENSRIPGSFTAVEISTAVKKIENLKQHSFSEFKEETYSSSNFKQDNELKINTNLIKFAIKKLRSAVPKTALLVDVENMPNFIDSVVQEISGLDIYAFVGEHHCLSDRKFPSGVIKILSPSTRSDGTDTCMQVYIGFLLGSGSKDYDNYLIATRDHYGSALVDMITNKLQNIITWTPKNAKVVTQITHIPTL